MGSEDKKSILLVEDEAILAMSEKLALEEYGYKAIVVHTGEKAVETIKNNPGIHLILMDIDLGKGIDGTEAAALILQDHDIPIVFCSSHTEPEIVEKTEKITSYGYVVKSSSNTVLDASIKMAFKLFEANRKIVLNQKIQNKMVSNIGDVIVIIDRNGLNQYKSPNILQLFGWKPEELIGKSTWDTVHPDDLEAGHEFVDKIAAENNAKGTIELRYKCKDGHFVWIEITLVNLLADPDIHGLLGNYRDITDRKRAESEIKAKNDELKTVNEALLGEKIFNEGLLECLPGYLYVYNDKGDLLRWNKKHETMTGFTGEELARKNMSDWFEGEDAIRVAAAVETVFRLGYGEVEANLLIKGGKKLLIHSNGVRLTIDNKTYFVGVGIDITERKQAEEKLKESNTLLRIAETTAKLGGWSIVLDSDQVLWSDEVASIHEKPAGYSPLLHDAIGFYAPEWRELIAERFGDCSQKGIPYDEEMEIITAKGKKVWVRSIGEAVRNDAGKIIKVQGAFQDISGQKKTELNLQTKNEEYESLNEELRSSVEELRVQNEELIHSDETLRKSEERYRLLLANLEAGIVVHASDTAIIMNNPRASELLGLSDDQMKGRKAVDPTWKFVYADGTPLPLAEYPVNRIVATGKPIESQVLGVHQPAKDSLVWLTVNGFPVLDKTGNIAEILVSFIDITERKRIGDALRQSEANFREVFDNIAHAVFIVDVMEDGGFRVGKSNKAQKIIAAISLEAEPGRLLEEAFPPEIAKILHANYRRAIESGKPIAYEEDVDLPGVGRRYYYTVISPVRNEAGRFYRIIGSTIDITDRTLAEERTKALLAEKELVLKEVNHRIKNNMAAMESLLRLQAGAIKEPIAVGALEDAGKRMQSMRLLYEKLYQSIGFTELPMANYVSPLIDEILTNFPGASSVKIEKHIDNFILDAKRLQPLGIIINELLTNIMKYAFADKSRGIITVSAVLVNGLVRLIVQDNGTGIPKSIDFENSPGFGLTLVHALAEQLDGEIRIERVGGTSIILDFEL